jgi:hypothetical protein
MIDAAFPTTQEPIDAQSTSEMSKAGAAKRP